MRADFDRYSRPATARKPLPQRFRTGAHPAFFFDFTVDTHDTDLTPPITQIHANCPSIPHSAMIPHAVLLAWASRARSIWETVRYSVRGGRPSHSIYVETHDDPRAFPKRAGDAIYERDGHTCMAPGCTARCAIEDHHLVYRSHKGGNEPWNRLCLCRFRHHQGEHGELAKCRGKAPLGVTWRLGRRDLATVWRNERRLTPLEAETAA